MTWALLAGFTWGFIGSWEVHYCNQCQRQPLFWRVGMGVMWPMHLVHRVWEQEKRRGKL